MVKIFLGIFILFLFAIGYTACSDSQKGNQASWRNEILKTDREFSAVSGSQGMKKAFLEYIDDDGILLRSGHPPIIGADAIEYITELNDPSYTLTWQPASAEVASSGDLGYSYGIYDLQLQDTTLQGTYVNIWKKDKNGNWKFVLDTGNQGIRKGNDSLSK